MFQKIAKHRANDASNDVHRPPLSTTLGMFGRWVSGRNSAFVCLLCSTSGMFLSIKALAAEWKSEKGMMLLLPMLKAYEWPFFI